MKSELEAIHERTQCVLKEVRQLRSLEKPSDAEVERLASLLADVSELCPPNRYAWIDGLPVIDVVAGLVEIEKERRVTRMESAEARQKLIIDELMKKLELSGKNAIAEFESAKADSLRLQDVLSKYKARKSELESKIQAKKEEARQSFEAGNGIETLSKKIGDLKSELEDVRESIEEIEDNRLPPALQAVIDAEKSLNKIIHAVATEYRDGLQKEVDLYVEKLEILFQEWPAIGYSLRSILKKNDLVRMPPLSFSSGALMSHYYPR